MNFLEKGGVLWFQSVFREFTLCYKIRNRFLGQVYHFSLLICYPYSCAYVNSCISTNYYWLILLQSLSKSIIGLFFLFLTVSSTCESKSYVVFLFFLFYIFLYDILTHQVPHFFVIQKFLYVQFCTDHRVLQLKYFVQTAD